MSINLLGWPKGGVSMSDIVFMGIPNRSKRFVGTVE